MVDISCSFMKAAISYYGHEHPLCFLERVPSDFPLRCHSCLEISNELMFRCGERYCVYSLCLLCGPLPVVIPYSYAGLDLSLTLTVSFLGGADADDCCCDICEQQRDPRQFVYHSSDPPFTATTDCILPQIIRALLGELGAVQLRTVKQHVFGLVYSQDYINQLLEADKAEEEENAESDVKAAEGANNQHVTMSIEGTLDSVEIDEKEIIDDAVGEFERPMLAWTRQIMPFRFSDEAFKQFKDHVAIAGEVTMPLAYWSTGDDYYVPEGNELILRCLHYLYQPVIEKYGDFTADSRLGSPKAKAMFVNMFLSIIRGMQSVRVFQVTGDLLCSWQWYLEVMRDAVNFKIQQTLDDLENLAHVCYALKFIEVRNSITGNLDQQIEQLVREIVEDKPKLGALKESYRRSKESSAFVKQCLTEASMLQWKSAGELLGLDPEEEPNSS